MSSERQLFTDACGFVMPLGKYRGLTIARIGSSNEGLLYLDWLIGRKLKDGDLKDILEIYLSHPAISQKIDAIIEEPYYGERD